MNINLINFGVEQNIKDVKVNTNESYLLVIDTIYGLSKADQPLKITSLYFPKYKKT